MGGDRHRLPSLRRDRIADPPPPLQPHHREDDKQRKQRRYAVDRQEGPEIEMPDRAEHDVLRIADQGRGRAGIGRRGECDRKRPRVEAAALRAGDQQRRDRDNQDVVGQDRRQTSADRHGDREQPGGAATPSDDRADT